MRDAVAPQRRAGRRRASRGVSPTMKRCAMCLTPAAAAAPSAARPGARVRHAHRGAPATAGGRRPPSRKPVRCAARSSSERHAGTTSTKRNSAARSSASCGGEVHRLVVERLDGVARGGRERRGEVLADGEDLGFGRGGRRVHAGHGSVGACGLPSRPTSARASPTLVVEALRARGHEPLLHGALADGERDDWAWCSEAAARDVADGRAEQGVVCCWTGTGASIAANKVPGVRAALCADAVTAAGAREWNDANVLALSLRDVSEAQLGGDPRRLVRHGPERRSRRRRERRARRRDHVIALNARAAARPELGGVERWARELRARAGWSVLVPPAALAHRAGHAWEQGALPLLRAALRRPRQPGEPRAGRLPAQRRGHPRRGGAARAGVVLAAVRALAADGAAARGAAGAAGRDGERVLAARAGGAAGRRGGRRAGRGGRAVHAGGAVAGRERPYVLTVASPDRAQEPRGAGGGRAATGRRGDRAGRGGRRSAAVPGRGVGAARCASGPRRRRGPSRAVRGGAARSCCRRCTRASGSRRWRRWRAGRPSSPRARGALPETCGDAARYADPHDPDGIADAIEAAIGDERLREAGPRRAAEFTWERTVRELAIVLAQRA